MKRKITQLIIVTCITSLLAITSLYAVGNDKELKKQIKELQNKVVTLEQELIQKNNLSQKNRIKDKNIDSHNGYSNNPFFDLSFIQNEMQNLFNNNLVPSQVDTVFMQYIKMEY